MLYTPIRRKMLPVLHVLIQNLPKNIGVRNQLNLNKMKKPEEGDYKNWTDYAEDMMSWIVVIVEGQATQIAELHSITQAANDIIGPACDILPDTYEVTQTININAI